MKNNYGDESDLIWSVFLTMINMGNDCAEVENKQREKCSNIIHLKQVDFRHLQGINQGGFIIHGMMVKCHSKIDNLCLLHPSLYVDDQNW